MLLFNSKATQKWQKINLILKEFPRKKQKIKKKGGKNNINKKITAFLCLKNIFLSKRIVKKLSK